MVQELPRGGTRGDVATRVLCYKTHQKWLLEVCTPICVLFEGFPSFPAEMISIAAGVEPEGARVLLQHTH